MHTCLYIAVKNTPLLIMSPLTAPSKQAYFPWERTSETSAGSFFKPELLLIGFCLDFNLGATIREVLVN